MSLEYIVNELKSYFLEKDVAAVYLFGSYVKNKNRKNSDLDIGLLHSSNKDPVKNFEKSLEYALELEEKLGITVDIVDVEKTDVFFGHQMMLNKILIIDKDVNRRVRFEVKRRKEYFDRKHFYKIYHQEALKRLERRVAE